MSDLLDNEIVSVQLPNEAVIGIEVRTKGGMEEVGGRLADPSVPSNFDVIATAIEGIAVAITDSIDKVSPNKAIIKFGIEAQVQPGGLLSALLVKGSSKANIEITLEWEKKSQRENKH